jgi:hypothetical protein
MIHKYRALRISDNEMVFGSLVCIPECPGKPAESRIIEFKFDATLTMTGTEYPVHPDSVGQFIGLSDKNGVEIYNFDIVMNQYKAIRLVKRTKYGEYRLFCGKSSSPFVKGWKKGITWEVIGNQMQHPHLLNE